MNCREDVGRICRVDFVGAWNCRVDLWAELQGGCYIIE